MHLFPKTLPLLLPLLLLACSSSPKFKLPTENERYSQIYLESGTESMYQSKFPQALGDLLEAVRYNPKNIEAWNNMGLVYYGMHEHDKARETWLKTLEISPNYSEARTNLGAMYLEQNKLAEAEQEFRTVLKDLVFTKSYLAHFNLAAIYLKQGKNLLAEQHLDLAVQANRSYCPAWFKLGELQTKKGAHDVAAESFRSGTQGTCYNSPETHYEMGRALAKSGKESAARAKFIEVIQNFGQSPWAERARTDLKILISEQR